MNALELAKELEKGHWEAGTREKAATMLRQQQVEITSLRKSLDVALIIVNELEQGLESSVSLNKAQAKRTQKK
jgi:type II secretory pathway component PulF